MKLTQGSLRRIKLASRAIDLTSQAALAKAFRGELSSLQNVQSPMRAFLPETCLNARSSPILTRQLPYVKTIWQKPVNLLVAECHVLTDLQRRLGLSIGSAGRVGRHRIDLLQLINQLVTAEGNINSGATSPGPTPTACSA